MPNQTYQEGIESVIDRSVDLIADTIKAIALTATYVPNPDHQFIDEGGASDMVDARVAGTTDQTLGGKAIGKDATGNFAYLDGNDSVYSGVPAGPDIAGVGIYKDTGTPTTSRILGFYDIADLTPNGGDVTIQWAAVASGALLKWASVSG
jgi:hypothetical protein